MRTFFFSCLITVSPLLGANDPTSSFNKEDACLRELKNLSETIQSVEEIPEFYNKCFFQFKNHIEHLSSPLREEDLKPLFELLDTDLLVLTQSSPHIRCTQVDELISIFFKNIFEEKPKFSQKLQSHFSFLFIDDSQKISFNRPKKENELSKMITKTACKLKNDAHSEFKTLSRKKSIPNFSVFLGDFKDPSNKDYHKVPTSTYNILQSSIFYLCGRLKALDPKSFKELKISKSELDYYAFLEGFLDSNPSSFSKDLFDQSHICEDYILSRLLNSKNKEAALFALNHIKEAALTEKKHQDFIKKGKKSKDAEALKRNSSAPIKKFLDEKNTKLPENTGEQIEKKKSFEYSDSIVVFDTKPMVPFEGIRKFSLGIEYTPTQKKSENQFYEMTFYSLLKNRFFDIYFELIEELTQKNTKSLHNAINAFICFITKKRISLSQNEEEIIVKKYQNSPKEWKRSVLLEITSQDTLSDSTEKSSFLDFLRSQRCPHFKNKISFEDQDEDIMSKYENLYKYQYLIHRESFIQNFEKAPFQIINKMIQALFSRGDISRETRILAKTQLARIARGNDSDSLRLLNMLVTRIKEDQNPKNLWIFFLGTLADCSNFHKKKEFYKRSLENYEEVALPYHISEIDDFQTCDLGLNLALTFCFEIFKSEIFKPSSNFFMNYVPSKTDENLNHFIESQQSSLSYNKERIQSLTEMLQNPDGLVEALCQDLMQSKNKKTLNEMLEIIRSLENDDVDFLENLEELICDFINKNCILLKDLVTFLRKTQKDVILEEINPTDCFEKLMLYYQDDGESIENLIKSIKSKIVTMQSHCI